ncbi:MAG TPA: zf-HC2 domain-containing protein [Thermoanaerobaculia bacterium]|nr:zf-HC2 domain-containing protein [Thermoanaerobaculia bacterium]
MPCDEPGSTSAHPKPLILGAFVRGELSGAERRDVLRHLLAGCRQCRQKASEMAAPLFEVAARKPPAGGIEAYDAPLRRVARAFSGVSFESRAGASRPMEAPVAAAVSRVRRISTGSNATPEELRTRAEGWLTRARALRYADPERMRAAASLAAVLAERIPRSAFPPGVVADLSALAWAELANGRRLVGDHQGAERAFSRSIHWIDRGSGDLQPLAEIAELVASLEIDARRFAPAERLLDRIVIAYRALGEPHFAGRTMIRRGVMLGYRGEGTAAVRQIVEGHGLLDPGRDPRLSLVAVHGLVSRLADAGRFELAAEVLRDGAPLYEAYAEPIDRIKICWTRGRIEIGMGRPEKGEKYLREGHQGFRDRGMPYFAALVALDLAALHLKEGKTQEVARSIEELLTEFRALGIRREAIACLMILQRAIAAERATEKLVTRVALRLGRFTAAAPTAVPAA